MFTYHTFVPDDPECRYIQDTDVEISGDHRSQIIHFCGHEPVCRLFNNPEALQIAKANIEKYYPVVGITENMNMTLQVLEHKMPEYFLGATEMYNADPEVQKYRHKNYQKNFVSDEVKAMVRANFTNEIELYDFCKQRLKIQYENLPLKP